MYYIENENNEILLYDEDLKRISETLLFMPKYSKSEIKTVPTGYTIDNFKLMTLEQAQNEALTAAKEAKYKEALEGAKSYIENGAYYRYDDNNTIEATDGNIGKLTAYALALQTGTLESVTWTSKEDNVLTLTADDVTKVLTGLGQVQAYVWNVQYIAYKEAIEKAESLEELESITIEYSSEVPEETPVTDNTEGTNDNTTDTKSDTVSDEVETKADNTKSK